MLDTTPVCVCHGVPKVWRKHKSVKAGGYFTCRVSKRESALRSYLKNAEYHRAHAREVRRAKKERDPQAYKIKASFERRKSKYGITAEEFMDLYEMQNRACAVCLDPLEVFGGKTCIDHDHETDEVRGILCVNCNFMVGHAKDDPDRLTAAAQYLRGHNARR